MTVLSTLSSLMPVEREEAVRRLLARGLWCPEPEEGEGVEAFVARLEGQHKAKSGAEAFILPGYDGAFAEERWRCLWRASGWAQQHGLTPLSLGRDFCRHWRDTARFNKLVASEVGEMSSGRTPPLCERVEIVLLVPNGEAAWPITHVFTNGPPDIDFLSPYDQGVLETLAFQIARAMCKRGSGAGLVAIDAFVAYRSPGPTERILSESGRTVYAMSPRFTMSPAFIAAIDERHRV